MRTAAAIVLATCFAACNSGSPAAPTPVSPPPVVSAPPVVVTPPAPPVVVTPPPTVFPPNDPRFDLAFYRQFVHNALDGNGRLETLRRQVEAPRIYLRTVDDAGAPIDDFSLNETANALINTTGALTGVFGLAGLERGTETREGQAGWITVRWAAVEDLSACGRAPVGGGRITLYPKTPRCRCDGAPAVRLQTVKHELGHALGFWHTDGVDDLMYGQPRPGCDRQPSAREVYHAAVAYTRPVGSSSP